MFGVRARARSTDIDTPWPPAPAHGLSLAYPVGAMTAIVYGSLLPFSIDPSAVLGATPLTGLGFPRPSFEDFLINLLLYVPLGCLVPIYLRRVPISNGARTACAVCLSFALSLSVEWIQVGTAERVASWFDVILNTLGGAAGAVLFAGARGRRISFSFKNAFRTSHTWLILLSCGLLLYSLLPFTPVADTQELHSSFARARWDITQPRFAHNSGAAFAVLGTELSMAIWFALLGALHFMAERGARRREPFTLTQVIAHGFVLAGLIEIVQLFSVSHTFDVATILLRTLAATFGAWTAQSIIAAWLERTRHDLITRAIGAFGLTVTLLAILFSLQLADSPAQAGVTTWESARFIELPFLELWRTTLFDASTEVLKMMFVAAGIVGLLMLLFRSARSDRSHAAVVCCAALCLFFLELAKVAVTGKTLDVTPVLVGVCVAFVAVDIANRLFPISSRALIVAAD